MPRFNRRRRFGTSRAAVTQSLCILKRKSKCRACGQPLALGDTVTRLRLKKSFQMPCTGCGHKPSKLKYFHTACVPADINKAMGYDPAMHTGTAHAAPGNSVPPPPKPRTLEDINLEALAALEAAVIAKAKKRGVTPEMEKAFKTFQNIKARVLRPGTPGEAEAATNVALKKIIDLVFG
jgi:hypothetical protein